MSLSLYIHTPWCIQKCPYCDFNSHKSPDILPEKEYVKALLADLCADLERFPDSRTIQSIFIGGGTPSLFTASAYETLFYGLQKELTFANDIEITLEANPGAVEQARFKAYRALGINRLSLGIQSFNAKHLSLLGRVHDDKQAHLAIDTARNAGFENINLDLMHGLPQQSIAEGINDLTLAINYQPDHISWYQLTIEPNTKFYKSPPLLPTEDDAYLLEETGFALLNKHGYKRYEISAFCKNNKTSKHNLNYWLFGDYFGIGAGAHGKITDKNGKIYRTRKSRQPKDYLDNNKPFLSEILEIDTDNLLFEFMLNTTRLQQPIQFDLFTQKTGLPFALLKDKLLAASQKNLIELNEDYWQITPFGRQYTNNLQALFLPE